MDPLYRHPNDLIPAFRHAFLILCEEVNLALRTQIGDRDRLATQIGRVGLFMQSVEMHVAVFDPTEVTTWRRSAEAMVAALQEATQHSTDPPAPRTRRFLWTETGNGRPKFQIDPAFLAHALQHRGSTAIGKLLGVGPRTVRRRALEHGLVSPGSAVYQDVDQDDGTTTRIWTSTTPPVSTLSNDDLDVLMVEILQIFPFIGRKMIRGELDARGHRVPIARIRQSYLRVHGPPPAFNNRIITRKEYTVSGVNSVWHHDGNHDLIRWRFVVHAFIDGKSRFVTALQISSNNRKETVLQVFLGAIDEYGLPIRVRGDHGVENGAVAEYMLRTRGRGRGSYIYGQSIHNTRSERLWVDYSHGVAVKWKLFFEDLEQNHYLNHDSFAHIWLLHHLFLDDINRDAQRWRDTWNLHKVTIRGGGERCPREMFLFGLVEFGERGMDHFARTQPDDDDDLDVVAVDEEEIDLAEFDDGEGNGEDLPAATTSNAFDNAVPERYNVVVCDEPDCPLSPLQIQELDFQLSLVADRRTESMTRRVVRILRVIVPFLRYISSDSMPIAEALFLGADDDDARDPAPAGLPGDDDVPMNDVPMNEDPPPQNERDDMPPLEAMDINYDDTPEENMVDDDVALADAVPQAINGGLPALRMNDAAFQAHISEFQQLLHIVRRHDAMVCWVHWRGGETKVAKSIAVTLPALLDTTVGIVHQALQDVGSGGVVSKLREGMTLATATEAISELVKRPNGWKVLGMVGECFDQENEAYNTPLTDSVQWNSVHDVELVEDIRADRAMWPTYVLYAYDEVSFIDRRTQRTLDLPAPASFEPEHTAPSMSVEVARAPAILGAPLSVYPPATLGTPLSLRQALQQAFPNEFEDLTFILVASCYETGFRCVRKVMIVKLISHLMGVAWAAKKPATPWSWQGYTGTFDEIIEAVLPEVNQGTFSNEVTTHNKVHSAVMEYETGSPALREDVGATSKYTTLKAHN
ncbi:hypothetical protein ONZ45_g7659 [Pleurotus djamor]|nr:hypothetical protein ONZ45_g7659 [Pleurotus djamor]